MLFGAGAKQYDFIVTMNTQSWIIRVSGRLRCFRLVNGQSVASDATHNQYTCCSCQINEICVIYDFVKSLGRLKRFRGLRNLPIFCFTET